MTRNSLLVLLAFLLLPASHAFAEIEKSVRWQLDVKGGAFQPVAEDWAQYYSRSYSPAAGGTVRYAVLPFFRIGISGQYIRASGTGDLLSNQIKGGEVLTEYLPVSLNVGIFGRIWSGQWLVPYVEIGGGVLPYSQYISHQSSARGWTKMTEGKVGVQLVLDWMEKSARQNLLTDYGISHSYLFFEYGEMRAEKTGIDLGGRVFMSGLGIEFR